MSRTIWRNSDGLKVKFGSSTKPYADNVGAFSAGPVEEVLVVDFDYTDLPSKNTNDTDAAKIPAGSMITGGYLLVDQAWVGGTSLAIGLVRSDGSTAIDADGLVTDAGVGAVAALTAGLVTVCDGALASNDVIGANDGYIYATATGTFTAGSARLVVKYIPPYTSVIV